MNLEQRIQRLEDIEAIKQLKARYLHGCDEKDVESIRQCFCPQEVMIDYGAIGQFSDREAFVAKFQELGGHPHIIDMHHGQNPQIQWLSETTATAIWDLYFFQINTQDNILTQLGGCYNDSYIKVDNQWLISASHFQHRSSHIVQMDQNQMQALFAGNQPPQG